QTLRHTLGDEVADDVQPGGAHGPPHPDFPSPGGDAHQHHVHDHDAAHDDGDRAHHDEHSKKRRTDAAPQSHVTFLGPDEKIVLRFWREMTAGTQGKLGLVLCRLKILAGRFHVDDKADVCALQAQKYGERHHDEVVLVLAEHAANFLHRANNRELFVTDAQRLAERVHAKK